MYINETISGTTIYTYIKELFNMDFLIVSLKIVFILFMVILVISLITSLIILEAIKKENIKYINLYRFILFISLLFILFYSTIALEELENFIHLVISPNLEVACGCPHTGIDSSGCICLHGTIETIEDGESLKCCICGDASKGEPDTACVTCSCTFHENCL